ncbi:MAG: hypothetical protein PVS2B1_17130 [Candidatus Dormibacteraceae bacterium]
MSRVDTAKTLVDIAKTIVDCGIAIADARRRAREEQERKDRECAEAQKTRKPDVAP